MKNAIRFIFLVFFFSSCAEEEKELQTPAPKTIASSDSTVNTEAVIVSTDSFVSVAVEAPQMIEYSNGESCEHAAARARKDTAGGKLVILTYGLPADMCSFRLWHSIMRERYGIEADHLGCVIEGWESCYNEIMENAIEKKYGTQIWQNVRIEVDSVCDKQNRPHEILYLKAEDVPVMTEQIYSYLGPKRDFGIYAGTFVRLPKAFRGDSINKKASVVCYIDTTGQLRSWEYLNGEKGSAEYFDTIPPKLQKRFDRAIRRASKKAFWITKTGKNGKRIPLEEQVEIVIPVRRRL